MVFPDFPIGLWAIFQQRKPTDRISPNSSVHSSGSPTEGTWRRRKIYVKLGTAGWHVEPRWPGSCPGQNIGFAPGAPLGATNLVVTSTLGNSLGANTLGPGKAHSSFEHGMSPTKLGSREGTMEFESRERRNDDHRSSHRIAPNLERFRL